MSLRIADIPPEARPRERLERLGLAALSDVELIALVIRSGKVGDSALKTAARLLADRAGIKSVSEARLEEISKIGGIGLAKAASLLAAFELGRRSAMTEGGSKVVRTPEQLANLAGRYLSDPNREEVVAVILGPGNRLIRVVPVSTGAAESCMIPVREILAAVLRNDGVAFAIAHNHPSGELRPSVDDVRSTLSVREAAERTGTRLLDHVIVSRSGWASLREMGYFDVRSD
jgi:DNA repair protein RadC